MQILYSSGVDFNRSDGPSVNEQEFVNFLLEFNKVRPFLLLNSKNKTTAIKGNNNVKVNHFNIASNPILSIFSQIHWLRKIRAIILSNKIDVVVLRLPPIPIFFYLFYGLVFSKVVVHVKTQGIIGNSSYTGVKYSRFSSFFFSFLNTYFASKILAKVSIIDACTPEIVKNLSAKLKRNDIMHVENAVNTQKFSSNKSIEKFSIPILGYIGGLPELRGAEEIIKILDISDNLGKKMSAVIVGFSDETLLKYQNIIKNRWKICTAELYGRISYSEIDKYFYKFSIGVAFDTPDKLKSVGSSNQKIRQYLSFGHPCIVPMGTNSGLEGRTFIKHVDTTNIEKCFQAAIDIHSKILSNQITKKQCRNFAKEYLSLESVNAARFESWRHHCAIRK